MGLLTVIGVTGLVGSHFGYTVNGVPRGAGVAAGAPGILGIVEWVWSGIVFLFDMAIFRVDDMPIFIGMIFGIMSIMTIFLIITLIRGN